MWEDNTNIEGYYLIEHSPDALTWKQVAMKPPDTTTFIHLSLSCDSEN
jgi:hypothetical protein